MLIISLHYFFFFFNDTATTEIYTLSLHDALPIFRAKLSAALIVQKINNSSCAFDTFPSVLAELKYKGVPDEVLMAMVNSPHGGRGIARSEEHTSELQSHVNLVCRLLLEKKKKKK